MLLSDQMLEMMNKRKSVGTKTPLKSRADTILEKSKEKLKEKPKAPPAAASPPCPPSPGPRQDFPGKNGAKAFLVAGQPMELRLAKVSIELFPNKVDICVEIITIPR